MALVIKLITAHVVMSQVVRGVGAWDLVVDVRTHEAVAYGRAHA